MVVPPSVIWKLVVVIALIGVIAPQLAGAPGRAVPRVDLRRLVLSGLGLYGVGAVASLTHHQPLAAVVYAAGIVMCALAAWLSRGADSDDPPEGVEPVDEHPPPDPDGVPPVDWGRLESEFQAFCEREPEGVGVGGE